MMAGAQLPLPEALVGRGFYKLGYVTSDREGAIDHFKDQLGFEEFAPFEPTFEAHLPDGRVGPARLRCAFAKGRETVVELMQPVDGLVDLWAHRLQGSDGFAIRFHHIGLVAEDLGAVKQAFGAYGIEPLLESTGALAAFAYFPLPGMDHMVEHIQYFGDGGRFLDDVRSRPET